MKFNHSSMYLHNEVNASIFNNFGNNCIFNAACQYFCLLSLFWQPRSSFAKIKIFPAAVVPLTFKYPREVAAEQEEHLKCEWCVCVTYVGPGSWFTHHAACCINFMVRFSSRDRKLRSIHQFSILHLSVVYFYYSE